MFGDFPVSCESKGIFHWIIRASKWMLLMSKSIKSMCPNLPAHLLSGEAARRSCSKCHGRMSSFSLDRHLFCTKVCLASSPVTCVAISSHVANGTELGALVRVQTDFSIFWSKCLTKSECFSHKSLTCLACLTKLLIPCGMESVCAFPPV